MGRLLREEDVQKTIYNLLTDGTIKPTSAMENYGFENTARLVVSNIPSAFDVETVISELENNCEKFEDEVTGEIAFAREEAIEIIRKGGVK